MKINTVNQFRTARGRVLRALIDGLAAHYGRNITVLDVGGRPDYWKNVGLGSIARIELVNISEAALNRPVPPGMSEDIFVRKVGDATDLADYADGSVDLVHSNSVIEHVGAWGRMAAMAGEAMRIGRAGWIQTPAWIFPMEPHHRTLFSHWFGRPLQARMMVLSFEARRRKFSHALRRRRVDGINLLSRGDVEALFPGLPIYVERFALWPKSYSVFWTPDGLDPATIRSRGW